MLRPFIFRTRAPRLWGGKAVAAGALVAGSWAAPAHAQPFSADERSAEQVELTYLANPECPSKKNFVREVSARIRRPVEWVVMDGEVQIALSLSQSDGASAGRLEVARGGAAPSRREFTAATCHEVASALALVVALSLDPNARTGALPEVSPEPTVGDPTPAPLVDTPAPSPPPVAVGPRPAEGAPLPAMVRKKPAQYAAWVGPVGGVTAGYAPEALITLGVSLGARFQWGNWLSPSLQLTPLWGKTGTTGPAALLGTFEWAMARLEVCPVDVKLTAALGFSPCLSGELGRLTARGTAEGVQAVARERWWAAPGVTAALHWSGGRWFVRLSGEGMFPATRDEFVFRDPERRVHQSHVFAYGARLGVGFQLGP